MHANNSQYNSVHHFYLYLFYSSLMPIIAQIALICKSQNQDNSFKITVFANAIFYMFQKLVQNQLIRESSQLLQ